MSEDVQDTYLVGGDALRAMSGTVESDRIIQLHYRRKATDDDRKWLLDAINAKLLADAEIRVTNDRLIAVQDQLAVAKKALEEIASDGKNCVDHCRRKAARALTSSPEAKPEQRSDIRRAAIEECALIAEGFDAASDSPRMKPFVDAGVVIAVYRRDGEIGAAIRAHALKHSSKPEQKYDGPLSKD